MSRFINIQSLHSTSTLGTNINPEFLSINLPSNTSYEPKLPHRIYYFLDKPKIRFTIFRSGGTLVMFGGKSSEDAIAAVQSIVSQLQAIGMDRVQYHPPTINNICASGYMGFKVHLPHFSNDINHIDNADYETDQFPGLRYRRLLPTNPSITAIVFHSGKCVVTGAKHQDEIIDAFDKLLDICTLFKIKGSETYGDDAHIRTNIQSVDPFKRFIVNNELYLCEPLI